MTPQDDFERLWRRYDRNLSKLSALLTRGFGESVCEDLMQETRIKAFKRLGSYDRDRAWGNWVIRIMQRTWIDMRGKISRRPEVSYDVELGGSDSDHPEDQDRDSLCAPDPELERVETIDLIVDALRDWDPLLAADCILRAGYGYTIDEAAPKLGYTPAQLRTLLDRRRRAAMDAASRRRSNASVRP